MMEHAITMNISTATNKMRHIFVDTWAWYALTDRNDADHLIAEATNRQLIEERHIFVTTNYVLSETVTLVRYKLYHAVAVQFWKTTKQLIGSGLVKLIRVSALQEEHAWEIFEQYNDQDFSFTDCTSFAVMKELKLSRVFTGDDHFATMGFVLVP
jgi:predicted nucleic acid-binding protein